DGGGPGRRTQEWAGRQRGARSAHERGHGGVQCGLSAGRADDVLRERQRRGERHPLLLLVGHRRAHERARYLRRCARAHVHGLPGGERRSRRALQVTSRDGHPGQLLPEPPRRGEPGPRAGLHLRVVAAVDLSRARQPPEERGTLTVRTSLVVLAAAALAAVALWARRPPKPGPGAAAR